MNSIVSDDLVMTQSFIRIPKSTMRSFRMVPIDFKAKSLTSHKYKGTLMSTKEWVYGHQGGANLYQECFYDFKKHAVNPNPAVIQIENPENFSITREEYTDAKAFSQLIVEIPAERFDEIAIAWCKKRKLQGFLGGPVGQEWGSPDCDYE